MRMMYDIKFNLLYGFQFNLLFLFRLNLNSGYEVQLDYCTGMLLPLMYNGVHSIIRTMVTKVTYKYSSYNTQGDNGYIKRA